MEEIEDEEAPEFGSEPDLGSDEEDVCTYCGKSIASGAAECPYCRNYTDDKGPLGTGNGEPRKLSPVYVAIGWVLIVITVLPLLWALWLVFAR